MAGMNDARRSHAPDEAPPSPGGTPSPNAPARRDAGSARPIVRVRRLWLGLTAAVIVTLLVPTSLVALTSALVAQACSG